MPLIRLTRVYESAKNRFISRHNDNGILKSAIKYLERELAAENSAILPGIRQYFILTNLPGKQYDILGCTYIFNNMAEEIAPCFLFFPKELAVAPGNPAIREMLIAAVLSELGW